MRSHLLTTSRAKLAGFVLAFKVFSLIILWQS